MKKENEYICRYDKYAKNSNLNDISHFIQDILVQERCYKIASHKDIFPTLYALSLNEYSYLTLGGRNLFDKNAPIGYNFALNQSLYVDESGIYPLNTNASKQSLGLKYGRDIFQNGEEFDAPKDKAEFLQKYHKLNDLQTNYRIFLEEIDEN